ncbi:glycoside hydrolase family 78 protein [Streptomyces sp. NPDC004539]|uniref:glycoside hydrolase family 78 protein n=1 Tax=Streptomyces sp. NPDC004539 TaxID=3154280 RepID=UPI0033A36189
MTNTHPQVTTLRFEHHREPFGIGETHPRLSWTVATDTPGWRQAAYEVRVRDADGSVVGEWACGSGGSVLVPWPARPLRSRERLLVAVRVRGESDGEPGPWSDDTPVEAGLLLPGDWSARFVSPAVDDRQPPLLRGGFEVRGPVVSARLYATALGVYELELNGVRVGDHVLSPGWTHYPKRLRYQTYDVTSLVRDGDNVLGALLADGWYRGRLGFDGGRADIYGDRLALLAQLELAYADGTTQTYGTGPHWRASTGPVTASGLYEGETHDARRERRGWSAPGCDDRDWLPVDVLDGEDLARLVSPDGPPVRRIETVSPVAVLTSPAGRTLLDFGQNLVGRLRIRVSGEAGRAVTLRHAEILEDGELGVRPLRGAAATDTYVLRGEGVEEWEPRFTFHGFRYAEVDGWPEGLALDVVAVVCHTDMRRTGWFTASDPLLERLHENVVWSMRGNFLDVPTDCPQRDERLGWTGDLQVFAPTASFLHDCAGLVRSWLKDLALQQSPEGYPPLWVPGFELTFPERPFAAWGDAAVIVPWVLYGRFGDAGVLRDQYASMKAWVDGIAELTGERQLWDEGLQLGDWLDPSAPPDRPFEARTDGHLVATAYRVHSADLLARTATVLGEHEDAARYGELADAVRAAFGKEYVTPGGRLVSDSQTAYALALRFALLPEPEQRERAGRRLAELVRDGGFRIGTGFVGTPLICDALCEAGAYDTAYRMLLERVCPSWLYPVTMGATTIWERWDSMLPDGSVNPGDMTSFNHYALGAVADHLHRSVAGLAPAAPGYRALLVRPRPGGRLAHASAAHETPYGRAEVAWSREGGELTVRVVVPPNTTARVELPGASEGVEVGSGRHWFRTPFRPVDEDVWEETPARY